MPGVKTCTSEPHSELRLQRDDRTTWPRTIRSTSDPFSCIKVKFWWLCIQKSFNVAKIFTTSTVSNVLIWGLTSQFRKLWPRTKMGAIREEEVRGVSLLQMVLRWVSVEKKRGSW